MQAGQIKDLNIGDAGQIKDLNIGDAGKSKTSHTVGFVGSVRSSLPLCPQILAYLFVMVLDLIFKNPLRLDTGNIRRH